MVLSEQKHSYILVSVFTGARERCRSFRTRRDKRTEKTLTEIIP